MKEHDASGKQAAVIHNKMDPRVENAVRHTLDHADRKERRTGLGFVYEGLVAEACVRQARLEHRTLALSVLSSDDKSIQTEYPTSR